MCGKDDVLVFLFHHSYTSTEVLITNLFVFSAVLSRLFVDSSTSTLPSRDHFDRYQHEGYCAFPVPIDWNVIRDILVVASQGKYGANEVEKFLSVLQSSPDPPATMAVVWNALVYGLQALYGGLYVPFDGLMVGVMDQYLETRLTDSIVFTERILPEKLPWGLILEEVGSKSFFLLWLCW